MSLTIIRTKVYSVLRPLEYYTCKGVIKTTKAIEVTRKSLWLGTQSPHYYDVFGYLLKMGLLMVLCITNSDPLVQLVSYVQKFFPAALLNE